MLFMTMATKKSSIWKTKLHIDVYDLFTAHKKALDLYIETFAHKEFMPHQVEGLPKHPACNAHVDEETKFVKTVRKYQLSTFQKFKCRLKTRNLQSQY